jgi:glycosyltransferase involved in cell wall biosynthesis
MTFKEEEYPNEKDFGYRRVWTKHINTYATNYSKFDISLAPIKNHIFNRVKSQLKVIEAGFHKKAIIAQNYGPYTIDLVSAIEKGGGFNDKANGILIDSDKNHKDWFGAIKKLVNNPEMVKTLQENLHNTVKDTYNLNNTTKTRMELYKKLIQNKTL